MKVSYSLALHGGTGTILPGNPSAEADYRQEMIVALNAGTAVLEADGSATDAVVETVRMLEDCPLFNAGRGAVFTEDQVHELDAAVMAGTGLQAGAVAGVRRIRNPVVAAAEVMRAARSVLLGSDGAEKFARARGLALVEPDYFSTPHRLRQLQDLRAHDTNAQALDHDAPAEGRFGTVGAVARDREGRVAAATSTGGVTNKQAGRIGDTPVIGAGTYANDRSCAISATGTGEHFIRACTGHDIHARMVYAGLTLDEAMAAAIAEELTPIGGRGGLIGVDTAGNIVMQFNSNGMYRAWVREGDRPQTAIF